MTHYMTRAVLDRQAPEHALRPLLDPTDRTSTLDAHRRLVWTLFPGRDAKRDFLWRADGKGKFLVVSAREPRCSRLFKPLDSKPYAPALVAGDRLAFVLRANATRDRRSGPGDDAVSENGRKPRRDRRVDIVMHAMREHGLKGRTTGSNSRAARRMEIAGEAARSWIVSQGDRHGFQVEIDTFGVDDYRVSRLKRRSGGHATFGVLDLTGLLTVRDPKKFTSMLFSGLGRARAFGCGLMLVRRA